MGCGCGKPLGSIERPLIAGRPNGAEAVEMRLVINMGGAAAGSIVWVTGDGIATWERLEFAVRV